jgi:hypothetical protein
MELANKHSNEIREWSPASQFLSKRSFVGLEQKLGESAVEKASEGFSGIPMMYEKEVKQK